MSNQKENHKSVTVLRIEREFMVGQLPRKLEGRKNAEA